MLVDLTNGYPTAVTVSLEFTQALQSHQIELPEAQQLQIARYCELLWGWNRRLNLTRHTDYSSFVGRDVIDSVRLTALLAAGERVLDIGSGGGVPGIMVALLRSDVQVTLSETIGKKAAVLVELVKELELPCAVVQGRAELALDSASFNSVVARGVGPMSKILRWVQPYWSAFDRLLLIKGPRWVEERGEARHRGLLHDLSLRKIASYPIPGTGAESVILQITRDKT